MRLVASMPIAVSWDISPTSFGGLEDVSGSLVCRIGDVALPELALVTGAAQGIGRAIVERLAADGYRVLAVDADASKLADSEAVWRRSGFPVEVHALDVCDRGAVRSMLEATSELDLLVNNAGVSGALDPIHKVDRVSCSRVMDINLVGAFKVAQEAVRRMRAGARVINVASRGYLGGSGAAHYVASKAGVVAMTRSMAVELRWRGIRVNAVAPGMVETRLLDDFGDMLPALKRLEPSGGAASPEKIAAIIANIASVDADFVNGQVLLVDGGKSVGIPPL